MMYDTTIAPAGKRRKARATSESAAARAQQEHSNLWQRPAGALLEVGQGAFYEYERGRIEPSGPTAQLIETLDRYPEIVDELRSRTRARRIGWRFRRVARPIGSIPA